MTRTLLQSLLRTRALECDAVARRLAESLESQCSDGPLAEAIEGNQLGPGGQCNLEVEIRLGQLRNVRDDTPISLPIQSHAIVSKLVPLKFVPGITKEQFQRATSLLEHWSNGHEWSVVCSETTDYFFEIPQFQERVRVSLFAGSAGSAAIRKVNLVTFNVHGDDWEVADEESEVRLHHGLDYRIAVNLEHNVNVKMPPTSQAIFTRHRTRTSYENGRANIKFDLTQVSSSGGNSDNVCYELEVELCQEPLHEAIKRKTNVLSSFMYYCTSLSSAVGFLIGYIQNDKGWDISRYQASLTLHDLVFVSPSDKAKRQYKQEVSETLPIIGDYLFRAIKNRDAGNINVNGYRSQTREIRGPYFAKQDPAGPPGALRVVLEPLGF
ncbi:bifunctional RNA 5'-triphosphatase Cet1-Ctl1/mRNA triphosphatase Cet1-like superfamily/mRNA triphosphatase Cet1-like/CYTH-like domain superfamily [Babesia duncani]|uniref:mRNA 5'-phosphatase n=1 Tax=Babesia duncani TaxID=323732 RepID=A0AAD9PMP6_9APIC|nr:bifunctional RNA 5'-triphosphatase Cet1-Ctl1/mRNA triphosphatase Cet1-like superfamily/mRNA triphosphatase Cet1-like/CYTH-like domain superfamily [Babesia duncani]